MKRDMATYIMARRKKERRGAVVVVVVIPWLGSEVVSGYTRRSIVD